MLLSGYGIHIPQATLSQTLQFGIKRDQGWPLKTVSRNQFVLISHPSFWELIIWQCYQCLALKLIPRHALPPYCHMPHLTLPVMCPLDYVEVSIASLASQLFNLHRCTASFQNSQYLVLLEHIHCLCININVINLVKKKKKPLQYFPILKKKKSISSLRVF